MLKKALKETFQPFDYQENNQFNNKQKKSV
jgi:hypothetical protein